MAALKLLLLQARRHCLTKHSSHFHSPLFLTSHRSLSSSSPPSDQPEPNPTPQDPRRQPFQSVPIQPVSYPLKPKEPTPPDSEPSEPQSLRQPHPRRPPNAVSAAEVQESRRGWTREDVRYVKDAPSITPVSYPMKEAPLPDDKVVAEDGAAVERNEEMEKERRRIEAEEQMRKRVVRAAEEERVKVPFPLLIKPKKNEKPPVLDLNEAIRQVKVR